MQIMTTQEQRVVVSSLHRIFDAIYALNCEIDELQAYCVSHRLDGLADNLDFYGVHSEMMDRLTDDIVWAEANEDGE